MTLGPSDLSFLAAPNETLDWRFVLLWDAAPPADRESWLRALAGGQDP